MTVAAPYDPPLVFADVPSFLAWAELQPARYEMFDGEAQLMAGATRRHATIAGNAYALLWRDLRSPCEPYNPDFAVLAGPMRVFYPDASVSCSDEAEDAMRHPVVIVEVLSPSTAAADRGRKAQAYREIPSLRHLLLVEQDRMAVEHQHRATPDGLFAIEYLSGAEDVLRLATVDVAIPLADLYGRVSFPA